MVVVVSESAFLVSMFTSRSHASPHCLQGKIPLFSKTNSARDCHGGGWFCLCLWCILVSSVLGNVELLPPYADTGAECCRINLSVPRPLQTVQRAELWGVITALQASRLVHLGVDGANVVGFDGRTTASKKSDAAF